MYDPTDGCPQCGTTTTVHAEDCTYPTTGSAHQEPVDLAVAAAGRGSTQGKPFNPKETTR